MRNIDPRNPRERDLSPLSHSVLQLACRYFRIRLATIDAFPSDTQVVSWIKASFRQACTDKNAPRRGERFHHEAEYYKYIFQLIKRKMSQLRNKVKVAALSSMLQAYGITLVMSKQEIKARIAFLKLRYGFTFENPDNRTGLFRHPIFATIAMELWFKSSTSDAIKCSQSFNPFPIPTLALIATAVKFALDSWSEGQFEDFDFEADKNVTKYRATMTHLMEWKEKNAPLLADVQYTLWRKLWAASGHAPLTEEDDERQLDDADFGIVPQDQPLNDTTTVTHTESAEAEFGPVE
ncbi:hypothetical protein NLI96_g11875 [Meripilus lineatus]|uniref:DUF6532 domain-containing protein n=1 Tax=Meripilus lineatus TaxID=2056292 RepID=A0AAD5UR18_9APHY|nr:hypothetical protein NLI96_g11875 [Physisporinus lineatus]